MAEVDGGSIISSYATGAVDGGEGDEHRVGGLVGLQMEAQSSPATLQGMSMEGGVVTLSAAWWGCRVEAQSSPATLRESCQWGPSSNSVGGLVGQLSTRGSIILQLRYGRCQWGWG